MSKTRKTTEIETKKPRNKTAAERRKTRALKLIKEASNHARDLSHRDKEFILRLAHKGERIRPTKEQLDQLGRISLTFRGKLAQLIKKICYQIGDSPEEKLMKAIFSNAVDDAFFSNGRGNQYTAVRWLLGDMSPVSATGLNPEWVRLQFKRARVPIDNILSLAN